MPPPVAQERWSILAGIPKVLPTEPEANNKRKRRPAITISVDLNKPPNASILTIPRRVSSAPNNIWYPYVAAADPSGLLLLRATEPFTSTSCIYSYHLCDAATGKVAAIPRHFQTMCFHGMNAGLLRRGRRDFMVAELRPTHDGSGRATLLCFTAGRYNWVEKELTYSPPLDRHYFGEGVVSHAGMLWWIDLSYGILACDPFADEPELLYVPLPWVPDELPPPAGPISRGMYRCVKVSDGRLRHVQIHGNPNAPVVTMWALADPAPAGDWFHERTVAMADVWADQSYKDTSLPRSVPTLALIHPMNPDKVYFFINSCIFAVDLRLRKVVEFSQFSMPKPPPHLNISSHFVHVWQNDPSCRPDVLPSCFNKDNFSIGPDTKKLIKRFEAAHRRSTAAKPVTFPAAQSRGYF
ncbi:unnamed protein product [Urochloa decumbens]|uniref:DUF1618 domain-containing protein n=1 Tax=Urochloa decumbens TaxID=240449 RepID=A0ABC9GDU1_9POAL